MPASEPATQPHAAPQQSDGHARTIILTGVGRSGTVFTATLLNHAENVVACHEHFLDKHLDALSYYKPDHPYVDHALRRGAEALRQKHPEATTFVDVNGRLRNVVDNIERELAPAQCFHLVRDGRRVVRSHYTRKAYTDRTGTLHTIPHDPELAAEWDNWSRFEKLCWYWRDTADRLLERGLPVLRFEDVISDYDILRDVLLEPADIKLTRDDWEATRHQPLNATRFQLKWLLPWRDRPLEWTADHERRFRELCGPTMKALGYKLDS